MTQLQICHVRSATEQPDVTLNSTWSTTEQPHGLPQSNPMLTCQWSATEQPHVDMPIPMWMQPWIQQLNRGTLPPWEIHVDFKKGMWWVMPHELSDAILQTWSTGAKQVSFVWDWEATRQGSYCPDGEGTSISRYMIDFETMLQRNLDNDRTRKVKVVGVLR